VKNARPFLLLLGALAAAGSCAQTSAIHLPGDNGPAIDAEVCDPEALAIAHGALFIAEGCGPAIRKVDLTTKIVSTLTRLPELTNISKIVATKDGNLIAVDTVHDQILRINSKDGLMEVIAGTGQFGNSGDGGPAVKATLNQPYGLALDAEENLFVSDGLNKRIRRIDARSGIISTVVGCGKEGIGGDGGPAIEAGLDWPMHIAFDHAGNLYIAQNTNDGALTRIRKVDFKTGLISTFIKAPNTSFSVSGDLDGNLYLADGHRIKKFEEASGTLRTIAGCAECKAGFGRPAQRTRIEETEDFTFDESGNMFLAYFDTHRIPRIRAKDGFIEIFAGNGKPHHVHVIL